MSEIIVGVLVEVEEEAGFAPPCIVSRLRRDLQIKSLLASKDVVMV